MPNWKLTISRGYDFVSQSDEDKTFQFWADDKKDAEDLVVENWQQFSGGDKAYFQVSLEELKSHGGSRPGAGRPKKSSYSKSPTKALRLPEEIAKKDELIALIELLRDWRAREKASCKTSVRWEKLRELMDDVESLGLI